MSTPATGTCIAFSATAPASHDDTGFAALSWTPATELREAGELGGERSITSNTNLCTGEIEKTAGSIDNGDQSLVLAFDIDNGGQVIVNDGFQNNTPVYCRETLTSGDVFYYKAISSKSKFSTTDGDEVKWMGNLAITGSIVTVAA